MVGSIINGRYKQDRSKLGGWVDRGCNGSGSSAGTWSSYQDGVQSVNSIAWPSARGGIVGQLLVERVCLHLLF